MSKDRSGPQYARIPIADQIETARSRLHETHKACERDVRFGRLTRAEADRHIATARAIRDTLVTVAEHREEFASLIRAKAQRARDNEEIDALRERPAVAAVLAAFPDAEIGLPGASIERDTEDAAA